MKRPAAGAGETSARVALVWVINRPGVAPTLMGVSRAEQVADNAQALALTLSPEHLAGLDAVSGDWLPFFYSLFQPTFRNRIVFGGAAVRGWRE